MNEVNKTLYIPLYGKSYVSNKGIIITDEKAEEIWKKEKIKLKGKSKSKWLAYYMSIRAAVFDDWIKDEINKDQDAIVLHIGCGMDSRVLRVGALNRYWLDIDFDEVIQERKKYYINTEYYRMISCDVRKKDWLINIPKSKTAIIVLEGISMYLTNSELKSLILSFDDYFENVSILMDCYSNYAAKMSRYKNPINDVGVRCVYGVDDPLTLNTSNIKFLKQHIIIPQKYIDELKGFEKFVFSKLYAGKFSKKLYKLYEFRK